LFDAETAMKQTIEHADQALYAAKRGGRNQLVIWSEEIQLERR
jgi:PleD family two-component response regulator